MTFSEKYGRSADTPDFYKNAVNDLGLEAVASLLPWSKEELTTAYAKNEYFNTNSTPLDEWVRIAGYHENRKTGHISSFGSQLKDMLYKAGVNYFSLSELVCTLKEAARMVVEAAS